MKKYSILMFNFNDYELFREPAEIDNDCEYVYVTDNKNFKSDIWTVVYTEQFKDKDAIYASFYVRYHPFEFVTTDVCFLIDGSIQIKKSLAPVYNMFMQSNCEMLLSCNCFGQTFGTEVDWWANHRSDCSDASINALRNFIDYYKMHDYHGCFEVGFKCVKRNLTNSKINEMTWAHLLYLSKGKELPRVDQTVFGILYANMYSDVPVFKVTRQAIQSKYLQYCYHKTNNPVIANVNLNNVWFLNKKIQVNTL